MGLPSIMEIGRKCWLKFVRLRVKGWSRIVRSLMKESFFELMVKICCTYLLGTKAENSFHALVVSAKEKNVDLSRVGELVFIWDGMYSYL